MKIIEKIIDKIINTGLIILWIIALVGIMTGIYHKDIKEVAIALLLILVSISLTYASEIINKIN